MRKFITGFIPLLLLLFFTSIQVSAQSDWLPGFVVLSNGDSLKGKVGRFISDERFTKCYFKEGREQRVYLPGEISSYGFENGKIYASIPGNGQFGELIAQGQLSLYKQNRTFFIGIENSEAYLLSTKKNVAKKEGQVYVSDDQKWKSVLYGIVSSCGITPEEMKALSFGKKEILAIVERYNDCKGGSTQVYKSPSPFKKVLIDLGTMAAYRTSQLNVSSVDGEERPLDGNHKSSDVVFGAFIDIGFPNLSEILSLQIGVNYQSLSLSSSKTIVNRNPNNPNLLRSSYDVTGDMNLLSIPISLKAMLINGKISLFSQAGIMINNYSSVSSNLHSEIVFRNRTDTDDQADVLNIRSSESYFWWRLGLWKAFKGNFKVGLAFDLVFQGNALLDDGSKFSPFKQSGISLMISR